METTHKLIGILRIFMGWIFFWAFLDKLFGLGFNTAAERAWIAGGSPTGGFLTNAPTGPFAGIFNAMAGNAIVDWLFMLGLLGIGVALLLGILIRVAAVSGATMMVLMYAAVIPPSTNPIIDSHIIYAIVLVVLAVMNAGVWLGFGRWWQDTRLVQKNRWLI